MPEGFVLNNPTPAKSDDPTVTVHYATGPLDSLIGAAGGSPLPGYLGLVQAIAGIWYEPLTSSKPLRYVKNSLNTLGVIRSFRESRKPRNELKVRVDPFQEFREKHNLVFPESMGDLSGLLYLYAKKSGIPNRQFVLQSPEKEGPEKASSEERFIHTFRLASGIEFHFLVMANPAVSGPECLYPGGPVVRFPDHDRFLEEIGQIIWASHENKDLQLQRKHEASPGYFIIESIEDPEPYVSSDSDTWQNIERLTQRISLLRDRDVSRNILFHGPPGTGKSLLARSLARSLGEGRTLRIGVDAIEAAGTYTVRNIIRVLRPNVLLFDDMDRALSSVLELLHFFESKRNPWESQLIVIGTVNSIKTIDPALLRPGRFDEVIKIEEPGTSFRTKIVEHYFKRFDIPAYEESIQRVTTLTEGFAPADIREVLQCVAAIGFEYIEDEANRVRLQREHYSGDRCENYMERKYVGQPDTSPTKEK